MKDKVAKTNAEIDEITESIKADTKEALKTLLSEAVKEYMKDSINEAEEDEDEDSYEVDDVKDDMADDSSEDVADTEEDDDEVDSDVDDTDTEDTDTEDSDLDTDAAAESLDDDEDGDDEWAEFEAYKTSDGDYDFTGEEDSDIAIKAYRLMKDDDQIIVTKSDDGTIKLDDESTGNEYVIEYDPNDTSLDDFDDDEDDLSESVDLGYTDNYQDEDVMTNTMSSDSDEISWDGGVPKGNQKPWAGKGDGKPYSDSLYEEEYDALDADEEGEGLVDEITTVTSNNARKMPKTHTSEPRWSHLPYGSKNVSANGTYDANVVERIVKTAKAIQRENKQYKECVGKIRKALQEAALVNHSLGQIVKLFTENTTTSKEKRSIVERFSNVSTIAESKQLYESIKRELNKDAKGNVVLEKTMAFPKNSINETQIYRSPEAERTIDLMRRLDRL